MEGGPRSYEHEADERPDLLQVFADVEVGYAGFSGTFKDMAELCPINLNDERISVEMKNQFVAKLINEAGLEVPKEYEPEVARIVDQNGLERNYKIGESMTVKTASEDKAKADRDKATVDAAVRVKTERPVKPAEPVPVVVRHISPPAVIVEKIPESSVASKAVGEVVMETVVAVIEADSKDANTQPVPAEAEVIPVRDVVTAPQSNEFPTPHPMRQPEILPIVTLPVQSIEKPTVVIAQEETMLFAGADRLSSPDLPATVVPVIAPSLIVAERSNVAEAVMRRASDTDGDIGIDGAVVDSYNSDRNIEGAALTPPSGHGVDAWASVINETAIIKTVHPVLQPEAPVRSHIEGTVSAVEAEQTWLEELRKTPEELFNDFLTALQIQTDTTESTIGAGEGEGANDMPETGVYHRETMFAGLIIPDTAEQLLGLIDGTATDTDITDDGMAPVKIDTPDTVGPENDDMFDVFGVMLEAADETMPQPKQFEASVPAEPVEAAATMILAAVVLIETADMPFEQMEEADPTEEAQTQATEAFHESALDITAEEIRKADLTLLANHLTALDEAARHQVAPVIAGIAGLVHGIHVLERQQTEAVVMLDTDGENLTEATDGSDDGLAQARERLVALCTELLTTAGLPPDAELPHRLAAYISRVDFQPGRDARAPSLAPADTEEAPDGEADLTRDGTHEAKRFDAADDDGLTDGSAWLEPAIGMFALFSSGQQRFGRPLEAALTGGRL